MKRRTSRSRYTPHITFGTLVVIALLLFLYWRANRTNVPNPGNPPTAIVSQTSTSLPTTHLGIQTKTSGCIALNGLPDAACTPGAVIGGVTTQQVCQSGYARSVRNVPEAEKLQAYREYGIASHNPGQYEVDHLVSLELGGSNDISNLWPELADPQPGFHQKDTVENYLHAQVCSGKMPLPEAQTLIASDWRMVFSQIR